MGDRTPIEWAEATWNPMVGCSRVSEGCRHCYAERVAWRLAWNRNQAIADAHRPTIDITGSGPRWTGRVSLLEHRLDQPLRWRRPRRIFVNSLSDLFRESVPDAWIDRVFAVMALAPQHTFIVLTKRATRMRAYFGPSSELNGMTRDVLVEGEAQKLYHERTGEDPSMWLAVHWPLPNVWLLTSVENQETADERIPELLATPAAVRGISAEPLLADIDVRRYLGLRCEGCGADGREVAWCRRGHGYDNGHFLDGTVPTACGPMTRDRSLVGLDWCVGGFESGPNARPGHLQWARDLRDQCVPAGCAFFWKQNGEWLPVEGIDAGGKVVFEPQFSVEFMKNMRRWDGSVFRGAGEGELAKDFLAPGVFAVRTGKKRAGRLLDGREWSEFPR